MISGGSAVAADETISARLGTFHTICSRSSEKPNSLCARRARSSFGNTTSRADRAAAARSRARMGCSTPGRRTVVLMIDQLCPSKTRSQEPGTSSERIRRIDDVGPQAKSKSCGSSRIKRVIDAAHDMRRAGADRCTFTRGCEGRASGCQRPERKGRSPPIRPPPSAWRRE